MVCVSIICLRYSLSHSLHLFFSNDRGIGESAEQAKKTVEYIFLTSAAVWLGASASSVEWKLPSSKSVLQQFLSEKVRLKKDAVMNFINNSPDETCQSLKEQLNCSHYALAESAESAAHRQASMSCAPTFMLPGFMKSGTTFLFDTLGKHPQVCVILCTL